MQSYVEASLQHGIQAFHMFSKSFLKTVKCHLDFCRGVGERRNEKSSPGINTIHKIIQERAGRAASRERKLARRPIPVCDGYIKGGNMHNVKVNMRSRTPHKYVPNP